ncbi:MAG: hypothetical protein DIJKHBIC_02055 [Thermoanaerobaculia bacterium]|nr:hypothetical protein [Thermoanaerobaculia bacterium]
MSEKFVLWSEDQPLSLTLMPRGDSPVRIRAAGSSFQQGFLRQLGVRTPPGRELVAWLWPEPENPFHGRAIRVMVADPLTRICGRAGYLPREVADRWFPFVRGFELETRSLPAFPAWLTDSGTGTEGKGLELAAPRPGEWLATSRAAA